MNRIQILLNHPFFIGVIGNVITTMKMSEENAYRYNILLTCFILAIPKILIELFQFGKTYTRIPSENIFLAMVYYLALITIFTPIFFVGKEANGAMVCYSIFIVTILLGFQFNKIYK